MKRSLHSEGIFANRSSYPMALLIAVGHLLIPTESKATVSKEEIEIALQSLLGCQKNQVQKVDDRHLDARIVALKLTNLCLDEYENLNKMTAQNDYDTSNERRMFTIEQNSRMLKIEASFPVVKGNREKALENRLGAPEADIEGATN